MKKIIIISTLILAFFSVNANNKTLVYKCYISQNMTKWKELINTMEAKSVKSEDYLFELLNYEYGYVAWCVTNQKKEPAEKYIEMGMKHIEYLENKKVNLSLVYAYKSAFMGFQIGIAPYKAPLIGYTSLNYAKKAVELDENNYFAYMQYASAMYHTPQFMGGSKTVALVHYIKAKKIMEMNLQDNDWNYLYLLIRIAKAYSDLQNLNAAKTYYENILKIEPEFSMVKEKLYPELLSRM